MIHDKIGTSLCRALLNHRMFHPVVHKCRSLSIGCFIVVVVVAVVAVVVAVVVVVVVVVVVFHVYTSSCSFPNVDVNFSGAHSCTENY